MELNTSQNKHRQQRYWEFCAERQVKRNVHVCARNGERKAAASKTAAGEPSKTDLYDAATPLFSARFRQSAGVSGCECSHCTGSPFMLAVKPNTFGSDFRAPPLLGQMFRRHSAKLLSAAPAASLPPLSFSLAGQKPARESGCLSPRGGVGWGGGVAFSKKEMEKTKQSTLKRLLTAAHYCQTETMYTSECAHTHNEMRSHHAK